MNEVDDRELLISLIDDEKKQQYFFKLEGKRGLIQHWSVELEAWRFWESDSASLDFSKDDYVQLQFVWHL
jgi:hypothetical protein